MAQKRYQYHILKRYRESSVDMPRGVLVMYNYAVDSYDEKIQEKIYGFAEFNRKLTADELKTYNLVPAKVDDSWI